jgi:phospholipase/lecithinase/hemolysin
VTQVQRLKTAGVTHILIMPVLDVSRTPWGRANTGTVSTTATNTFNETVLLALSTAFDSQTPNSVIYANASGVTSQFLTATSVAVYSPFTDTGFSSTVAAGTTPACGDATLFTGCAASVPTAAGRPYTTMLFADGIHLTPAGNRWVAQYLYNATAQGWR